MASYMKRGRSRHKTFQKSLINHLKTVHDIFHSTSFYVKSLKNVLIDICRDLNVNYGKVTHLIERDAPGRIRNRRADAVLVVPHHFAVVIELKTTERKSTTNNSEHVRQLKSTHSNICRWMYRRQIGCRIRCKRMIPLYAVLVTRSYRHNERGKRTFSDSSEIIDSRLVPDDEGGEFL